MDEEPSGWAAGFAGFAGVMLIVMGFFHACAGLVGIVDDTFYVKTEEWIFQFDITTWGWVHLIVGIVAVIAGFGIFTGNVAARTFGVVVAALSMLGAFFWLPWYPIWGVIIIAIDIAIIWALTMHGRDIRTLSER